MKKNRLMPVFFRRPVICCEAGEIISTATP